MGHRLGLVSVSFRGNTPREILEAMKQQGLSLIEWGSDVHAPPEKAGEIAALTREYGAVCCSYGTYFRLGVTPLSELTRYIAAAEQLGTNILRLWCGNKNGDEYTAAEETALLDECRTAAAIAEQHGVVLCMECHRDTFTNDKACALRLMTAVNSPHFKMYWQPSAYRTAEENGRYAALLAPYVMHVHVFHWKGEKKLPLGEAIDEWRGYLRRLGGEHTLLLEFMPDGQLNTLKSETAALKEIAQ